MAGVYDINFAWSFRHPFHAPSQSFNGVYQRSANVLVVVFGRDTNHLWARDDFSEALGLSRPRHFV